MKHYKLKRQLFAAVAAAGIFGLVAGCGEDPSFYENEKLIFENPSEVNRAEAKQESNEVADLSLSEKESSDFRFAPLYGSGYGYGYGYGYAYPLFDYYTVPLAVEIPVSPVYSLVDYVHPFYAYNHLNPYYDDDDGLYFRDDDD